MGSKTSGSETVSAMSKESVSNYYTVAVTILTGLTDKPQYYPGN